MFNLGSHRVHAVVFVLFVLGATAAKALPTILASAVRWAYRAVTKG